MIGVVLSCSIGIILLLWGISLYVRLIHSRFIENKSSKIAQIIDYIPLPIISINKNETINAINQNGNTLLNLKESSKSSKVQWVDIFTPESIESLRNHAFPAVTPANQWEGELTLIAADTSIVPVRATLLAHKTSYTVKQKSFLHYTLIFNDLRDALKSEQDRNNYNDQIAIALSLAKAGHWRISLTNPPVFIGSKQAAKILDLPQQKDWEYHLNDECIEELCFANPRQYHLFPQILQNITSQKATHFNEEIKYTQPTTNKKIWIKMVGKAVINTSGSVTDIFGVVQDISTHKSAEKDLIQAKDTAESASKTKGDFLANMSHEFRTPLNIINGMVHLLQEDSPTNKQSNYLGKVTRASSSLLHLINDILDYSKIEAGQLALETTKLNLEEEILSICDVIGEQIGEKKIQLHLDMSPKLPSLILGDSLRLSQIITNLLSNAIKFTEEGDITITIVPLKQIDTTITIQFAVTDTGIGIPKEHQKDLFDSFTQADSSTTRIYGGTGLGLAICKELTKLMGGTIGIQSQEGIGSTFFFKIPFEVLTPDTPMSSPFIAQSFPKNILILESSEIQEHILSHYFEAIKRVPVFVSTPQQLIAHLEKDLNAIDLIILNPICIDSKVNTLEHEITSLMPTTPYQIMALSSSLTHASNENVVSWAQPLKTPFTPQNMYNAIAHHNANTDAKQHDHLTPAHHTNSILIVEDHPINREIVVELLSSYNLSNTVTSNGKEALALTEQHEYDCIFMDIHMPIMDGVTATKAIRSSKTNANSYTPIIAMSGDILTDKSEILNDAGFSDFLSKPINPQLLKDLVEKYTHAVAPITPNQSLEDDLHIEGINTAIGIRHANNNHTLYLRLLQSFAGEYHLLQQRINIATPKQSELLHICHNIKGVSASIGAYSVRDSAEHLENCLLISNSSSCKKEMTTFLTTYNSIVLQIQNYKGPQKTSTTPLSLSSGTLDELVEILLKLRKVVKTYEPLPSKEILSSLSQKTWSALSRDQLEALSHAINRYQFDKAAEILSAMLIVLENTQKSESL